MPVRRTFSRNAAGMAGDATSLAIWGWQLFSGQILQPQSLAAMKTFESDDFGLGVESMPGFGQTAYGHAGSKPGYGALMAVLPDRNTVIVMFINNQDADVFAAAGKLLKVVS